MKYAVDQTHIRSINQRVILDSIFKTDTVSRAELSRMVKISKSAMTENISSLLEVGIIEEIGSGQAASVGGRKPILLRFNKTFQYIIAIDLNYEDAIFVLANLAGEIENKFTIHVCTDTPYAARLELTRNAIGMLMSSQNILNSDLAMIAISAPGIMHPNNNQYQANKQFLNWQMADLAGQLNEYFGTEVLIVNDVNAAAVGEFHHGEGKTHRDILYVSCGLGVGAGLIINHSLHEGFSRSAGEIANFVVDGTPEAPITLENRIKIGSLLHRIREEAPPETLEALGTPNDFNFKDVVRCWRAGDSFVNGCVDDISNVLGVAISNIVSLLNVDLVIIGGEYRVFASRMLPIINRIVSKTAFSPVEIVQSKLNHDAGIYGLFTMVQDKEFTKICSPPIKAESKTVIHQ